MDGYIRPPPHLAGADYERLKEPLLHFDSAVTTSGAKPVADHGPIALLDHIQRLGPYPLKDLSQARDVVTHPIVSPIRHVIGFRNPRTKLHIRFTEGHHGFGIQATHRLIRTLNALHVLLRHRERSIPQGEGGRSR